MNPTDPICLDCQGTGGPPGCDALGACGTCRGWGREHRPPIPVWHDAHSGYPDGWYDPATGRPVDLLADSTPNAPPKGATDVNEATKGAIEGVSTITPTGLATSAASGVTGKNIKSPLATAAGSTSSGGGTGAMASVEEVRGAIDQAMQKADSAGGAVQQAQSGLEEAQAQLMQATEGSGKSEFSDANALLARAVESIAEVQQSVQAAKEQAETGAGQL